MQLLEALMSMEQVQALPTVPQDSMYTDIITGISYPTLEEFLAGRANSDAQRMGNIQGGSGPSAFSVGFSGGFA